MTRIFLILAALLYLAMIVLALRPALDLEVARLFYVAPHHFLGDTSAGTVARYAAWALPFVLLLGMAVCAGLARRGVWPARLAPSGRSLAMLVLSMAIGPGLLVHAGLKEVSHRPRPLAVSAFGGPDAFRPWYRFDGACRHDCAFASGETAVATWTLASASLVPPPWRVTALVAALAYATATALWRMARGAHFVSDTIAAALIMIVVILGVRAALARRPAAP